MQSEGKEAKNTPNFNITFSSSNTTNPNHMAVISYLNEKIRYLEVENAQLKKEIVMKNSSDKKKDSSLVEYYLRVRKELLEEIEKLKNEKSFSELNLTVEIEKYKEEVAILKTQLNDLTNEKNALLDKIKNGGNFTNMCDGEILLNSEEQSNRDQDQIKVTSKQSSTTQGNLKNKLQVSLVQNETTSGNTFAEDNFFLNPNIQSTIPNNTIEITDVQIVQNVSSSLNNNSTNPYLPIIVDLEDRVRLLEREIKDKDNEILTMKESLINEQSEADSIVDELKNDIEGWKQKYAAVLTKSKSVSREFQELLDAQTRNFKSELEEENYQLDKKITHLEKLTDKYQMNLEKMSKMNSESEVHKTVEIEKLKLQIKCLIENYELLYKSYEENLKILTKQIDSMKQLYMARENEFINITNYYTESINDYSKPIMEANGIKGLLETNYISQSQECEELRSTIDKYMKEISNIRSDNLELKPRMRQNISDALKIYDENIKNIVDNHYNISAKLECIANFMANFEEKFNFFSSLLEDNKKLEEKITVLECQLKMYDIETKNNEIMLLKETIFKLQKDIEIKNNIIREFDNLLHGDAPLITSSLPSASKRKDFVHSDTIIKLKTEISHLTSQIISLNKAKEGIENFYQVELNSSMDHIKSLGEEIETLKSVITKMENDYIGKKETVFNLWMLEFKEFKENLITISDIKSIVDKFHIEGEELNLHKNMMCNEELFLIRQEIQIKDDSFEKMKANHQKEKNNLIEIINSYKKSIDDKAQMFEKLNRQKEEELNAVIREKERLGEFHGKKKKFTEDELNLWDEQRAHIKKILIDHTDGKGKEIAFLKSQIDLIQKELETNRKITEANLQNAMDDIETQLNLVKDAEQFTVSQLLQLEKRFAAYKDEKEKMIALLRDEIDEIKGHNQILKKSMKQRDR